VDNKRPLSVVAISGSLRRASSNGALVEAVARLAKDVVDEAVMRFRSILQACDAVLISSPEYAHGVPGVLKNALDWVVGSGELIDKPIALINASARATHARASLAETLATMSAQIVVAASITVSLDGRALDSNGIVGDGDLSAALRASIHALASAIRDTRTV
jgi:chromate reductase, NAD(P)H dehydrogenase (quinone)